MVDNAAQQATLLPRITPNQLTASDLTSFIRQLILQKWCDEWRHQTHLSNKLAAVKLTPAPWLSSHRASRREEVVILAYV